MTTEPTPFPGEPIPFLGEPPSRTPVPALEVSAVRGKRVVLAHPVGFIYDVRAISEVYTDVQGRERVDVCSEQAYYRWMLNGVEPDAQVFDARHVWID